MPVERAVIAADDSSGPMPVKPPAQAKEPCVESSILIGKKVSHYRVLSVIGGGGMGLVYEAEDLKLGRRVALKFLPEELASDPVALQRFEREAQTASSLNHPNICTIHEVEEYEGRSFIVMELLQGQTLRDWMAPGHAEHKALPLQQVLDVALQVAGGLQAAHEKGIIHRDIKPANIFLTTSGQVKILDFGVAKLMVRGRDPENPDAPATSGQDSSSTGAAVAAKAVDTALTRTGLAMGTAGYMSPEQIRGEKLDARTDIFSFGLVLYEMASGQLAFSGDTAEIVRDAILNQTPAPVHERNASIPPELEEIINRAIEKTRDLRYQSTAEMRADLQTVAADQSTGSKSGKLPARSRWSWLAAVVVVAVGMIAGGAYWRSHRPVKLAPKDTVVLADFANSTGDSVFDGTLKQALSIQLEQSPFLNVLSDDKISETLKLMNRPADERLTRATAQEVCLRSNSRALLAGSIGAIGEHYLIGLKAVNCQTSDTLASANAEAQDRNHVLKALNDVGTQLRERLGESLASVQKFNQPLEQATTSSLEALQAYTQAERIVNEQGANASIPYYERAIGLDPNFAIAYVALGEAYGEYFGTGPKIKNLTRAYELRNRVSQRERFNIESAYYSDVTGDVEKGIQTYTEWIQSYPDDSFPHLALAISFKTLGRHEKAAAEARDAVRLLPAVETYTALLHVYLAMDRLQDVKAVLRETEKRNLDAFPLRQVRYITAFIEDDDKSMKEQDTWAMGKPGVEALQYILQSSKEAYHGRFNAARDLSQLAEESATRSGGRELAALIKTVHSPNEAEIGDKNIARRSVAETLALNPVRSQNLEGPAALTLALLGDLGHARRLLAKMNQEFPLDTMMQSYTLPTIRAVIELSSNNPRKAIEILQIVAPHDLAVMDVPPNGLYPAYVRGLSYLNLRQGQQAATEFQKVIDHPGTTLLHLQGALAHLYLGRAQVMMGSRIAARKSYQDFLTLWKDADPDIPIYKQAKAEYAKLQ